MKGANEKKKLANNIIIISWPICMKIINYRFIFFIFFILPAKQIY